MNLTRSEKELMIKLVTLINSGALKEEFQVNIVRSGPRVIISGVDTVIPEITKGKLMALDEAGLIEVVEKPEWLFSVRVRQSGLEAVGRNFKRSTDLGWLTFWIALATLAATAGAFIYSEFLKQ